MSDMEKKEILGKEKDLEADELEAVAGGKVCACVMGGGGEADAGQKTCACVLGGGGEYADDSGTRCVCVVGGAGR